MAGLYIHVPFCGQLCTYCDFHFTVSLLRVDDMVEAMCCEIKRRREYLFKEPITTLYFGGGTPSILSLKQLNILISTASNEFCFEVDKLSEFTVECNPEDLTKDYLKGLKELGVNRLSIGIQSFCNSTLAMMNRRHNANRAIEAVKDAQAAGFDNISIDLIFGIPDMTDQQLISDLTIAKDLGTQHISVYHLTIEDRTVLGLKRRKGEFKAIADERSQYLYSIVEKSLEDGGFAHYEISNYAKEGFRAKHNSSYWDLTPYIGIGPSAHSFNGESRQWNVASNNPYIEALSLGTPYFEIEYLTEDEKYNEYVMTSLRCVEGVSLSYIDKRWGSSYFLGEAAKSLSNGVLIREDDRVRIETKNFMLSDAIIADLMR